MKIALGADHGGFDLKQSVQALLAQRGVAVEDVGCFDRQSVDYPDYAGEVARRIQQGTADHGVLICTTGLGMVIAANKFPGVRAALCLSPDMAGKARTHNDANVLCLAGAYTQPREVEGILDAWLGHEFSREERHVRRLGKIADSAVRESCRAALRDGDTAIHDAIEGEERHERDTINLIASENYASAAVRAAQGSAMTNKYAEGYPGKRWYSGCAFVDVAERLALERVGRIFGAEHANVQPHCGSAANMAVYFAALKPGDTILAMSLAHGGHLTHGHSANFSGRFFNVVPYGVRPDTECLDYDEVARLADAHRPRLIVAGASAYPRVLDFPRLRAIADRVGALLMVDMAHIAGLVAGGCHPSPVPYAEFVTSTTHKTLRGPRGGLILCRAAFAAEIDRQVFPGLQGGPLMHVIAAKAVSFQEALAPAFAAYAGQIVRNARAMAEVLLAGGCRLVSGGTDTHLMLVDLAALNLTGKDAAAALDQAGIIVNKNAIPFDTRSPFLTSGIRIGTPAVTTRGMQAAEMRLLAEMILRVLRRPNDESVRAAVRAQTRELAQRFPPP
jgi:glycine hydroxymethyltransferase